MASPLLTSAVGNTTLWPRTSTYPPTSPQISCSNGCLSCPIWRHSGLAFAAQFPAGMLGGSCWIRRSWPTPHSPIFADLGSWVLAAYMEALLPRMTTPLLEKLQIVFFNQLTFSIPSLLHFMATTDILGRGSGSMTRESSWEHIPLTCLRDMPSIWLLSSTGRYLWSLPSSII
ncbi:hypothetical protein BC826DRAFT_156549 [Russula brevipes]|nr:hypothetical protein BC826DRAFT_156549 [Russula brevipes]